LLRGSEVIAIHFLANPYSAGLSEDRPPRNSDLFLNILLLRHVLIDAFVICHTRLIRSNHHVHRIQIYVVEMLKNILKNILKTSEIHPFNGMLNRLFQFAHMREDAKVTST
jgi:hypothetical protein